MEPDVCCCCCFCRLRVKCFVSSALKSIGPLFDTAFDVGADGGLLLRPFVAEDDAAGLAIRKKLVKCIFANNLK